MIFCHTGQITSLPRIIEKEGATINKCKKKQSRNEFRIKTPRTTKTRVTIKHSISRITSANAVMETLIDVSKANRASLNDAK